MSRSLLFGCLLLFVCSFTGCGGPPEKPSVCVSIAPQAWIVERLAGDLVDVHVLVPPGASPATYQPTDHEVTNALASSVWMTIGVPFEDGAWASGLRSSDSLEIVDGGRNIRRRPIMGWRRAWQLREAARLAAQTDGPDEHPDEHDEGETEGHEDGEAGHDHEGSEHAHDPGAPDPHIWTAPGNLRMMAQTTAEALAQIDPDNAEVFQTNLRALERELSALATELMKTLQPVRGEAFAVFHPAWGYFADEYEIEQLAIEVEGKNPTDAEVTAVLEEMSGLRAIFVQPQIAPASAGAIADALGAKLIELDPLAIPVPENLRRVAQAIVDANQSEPRNDGQAEEEKEEAG